MTWKNRLLDQGNESFAKYIGTDFISLLEPFAPNDPKELLANKELKERAIEFGNSLASI